MVGGVFRGTESAALPGLLGVKGKQGSKDIVVGLETAEGKPLKFNQSGTDWPLNDGDTTLTMKAYVIAEHADMTGKNIELGSFSAIAMFSLEYE